MVGATFTVAAVAQVLRAKKGITAVGNAQVDTAQSQFGGASAYFDGTDDYLVANGDFSQAGDFTIECWFRAGRVSGVQNFMTIGNENTGRVTFYIDGSTLKYDTYGAGGLPKFSATGTISINTWYHIAAVRSGGTITIYRDGTSVGTASSSGIVGNSTNAYFGAISDSNSDYQGHLDEIRYSNTARYTANFTPSTTPFVNDANTLLLIHANGTDGSTFFEDDNGVRASRSLIAIGNAQVDTAQSKFGGSALLCDGTGDYVRSIAGSQFDFGTSSFTIEYFIRFNAINTLYVPIALRPSTSIFNGEWWCEITAAENKMYWGFKNQAGTQYYVNLALAGTAFATGQWYHIALVNNAGTAQMYVNGTATGATTALSGSFGNSSSDLWVGAGASAYSLNGWLDEVRISNTARYTTGFTPTTTPFVNDSNTLLLIHADSTDASTVFLDDNGQGRSAVGLSAIGNAKVSTAQSKFGGTSAIFDDSGDYLVSPTVSAGNFSGDFTVECWIYTSDTEGEFLACQKYNTAQGWGFITRSNNRLIWTSSTNGTSCAATIISSNNAYANNTWTHVAVCHKNSTGLTEMFANGVRVGSVTEQNPITVDSAGSLLIGGNIYGVSSGLYQDGPRFLNGYLDEIRFSNIVRYSGATYTIPTTPFQNDANTQFLLHCDGTNNSTVFFDDNGIAPYTP
jgi:hypothetical protein